MIWKYVAKFTYAGIGAWHNEFEYDRGEVSAPTKKEAKKKAEKEAIKAFSAMWKLHSLTVKEKL